MPTASYDTPLIARDAELARLTALLEHARGGQAHAVLLSGDAGVGKTRMLAEVAEHATQAGMTVVTGHCVDLGDVGLPYLPVTEILGQLAADERFAAVIAGHPLIERLRSGGGEIDGERDGGGRARLFEETARLLAQLAEEAPLLAVIEDLHWADQSTRDLLRFVFSRAVLQHGTGAAASQRLAIVASYRADDLHRRHPLRPLLAELVRLPAVERIELRPLGAGDVARLVRSLHPDPLPEATVARIVERAEGNAFYAEELLAASGHGERLPSGLADVLLTRFERLPPAAQHVLRTAAVAGRRVEHDLLRDAAGLPDDELEPALREAANRQLLVSRERDTYSFRHALSREAVYADLLPGERARLHSRYAALLATRPGEHAAERAHHARESHDLPTSLTASLEAADHARNIGAAAEELRQVETALDLWPAVEPAQRPAELDEVTLTLRASAAATQAGEAHRAVSLTRAALARVGTDADSELGARIRYTLAGQLLRVDSLPAAFALSSEALAMIPDEPPSPTWVWAAATHVMAANYTGDEETARRTAHQALSTAEQLGMADAQADLTISLVNLEEHDRSTPEGRKRLQEAYELARSAGSAATELRAMFNLAIGAYEAADLDESLTWLNRGLERARKAGMLSAPYPLELRYIYALTLYTLGRWDDCIAATAADAERMPAAGAFVTGPALYVALGRGEPGAADSTRALLDQPFDWMAHLVAGIVLTDHAAQRHDPQTAVAQVRTTLDRLSEDISGRIPDIGVRLAALALAPVADAATEHRRTGDDTAVRHWTDTAAELIDLARTTATEGESADRPGPEARAWLARAEAEAARAAGHSDTDAWDKAVTAFGYGDVYERARCQHRLAEALLAADRRTEAAEHAAEARETADRLGAAPLRDALDALIRRGRLGGAQEQDHSTPLTARERDVLLLLARGRTNRQIGEELFISGKTASVHVSNIIAKLGAAGRTQAVAIAYREGLLEETPDSGANR